jgi:hypothetical protein
MDSLQNLFGIATWISFVLAGYWGWRASRHLSSQGHDRYWRLALHLGWASRDDFSERGWKYHVRALWAALAMFASIMAAGITRFYESGCANP